MRRFYVGSLPEVGAEVVLDDAIRRHVSVLRLEVGATILLFDGSGRLVEATLAAGRATLTRELEVDEAVPFVALILALPKGSKSDEIVRMTTELGVAEIHLALTERSVPDAKPKRLERLERIAVEAARQSERLTVPTIHAAAPLPEVVARVPSDASKYVCWARASFARVSPAAPPRWLALGPEGGFTEDELSHFDGAGFERISIGAHVLRVDTAAAAAISWAVSSD